MKIVRILRDPTADWYAQWFPRALGETRPNVPWATVCAEDWAHRGRRLHCP